MTASPHFIERKALDVSGRLGSLYDASSDLLLGTSSVKSFENSQFHQDFKWQVLQGAKPNGAIRILKEIDFDAALLQSILLGMVKPSGISSLINYNQSINEHTRFLYYSYRYREEKICVTAGKADKIVPIPPISTTATHMITKIIWGFEILCVIQNSNNKSADQVERLLKQIFTQDLNDDKSFKLTDEQERQIREFTDVTIFGSKTYVDNPMISLLAVLTRLREWQNNTALHIPILYTMYPLNWLYENQQFCKTYVLSDHDKSCIARIEPMIMDLDRWWIDIQHIFKSLLKTTGSSTIDRHLKRISGDFDILLNTYKQYRTELRNIIIGMRQGIRESVEIDNMISNKRYLSLKRLATDAFSSEVQQWLTKIELIERFNNDQIFYINVLDIFPHENIFSTTEDIDAILKDYFSKKDGYLILWYSSDRLKREKKDEWEQSYQGLILERQRAKELTSLIYVDFSQCRQKLKGFVVQKFSIQSSSESRRDRPKKLERPIPSASSPDLAPSLKRSLLASSSPSQLPPATDINVLLLGETGVGKSTFINAFVNYLMFDTLQQAKQSKPIVLIPVAFVITEGDQFDEFIVKFGNVDANENHEHQGQSVTQQCKSYMFDLNDRIRLRLIDTPGMGDTRGIDQDDKNIDHVLTYINNLSHLNAICLLLKPNTSRLNVFFRSCINQLLTYLTPIGYNNIIFCFTNARSTFFAPGNTGPLLRKMLKKEHHDDISFQKENTFCFDSESFRYLAARKCGVTFDEFQTQECIKSWTTSVVESIRLLAFIQTREAYFLHEWQSPRKCALEISMLARPLMETLRLILYNWKLRETGINTNQIILKSNSVTVEICTNCAQSSTVQVGSFWLVVYGSYKNEIHKQCSCPLNERHFVIEYIAEYELVALPMDMSSDNFMTFFDNFLYKCDRLSYFLQQKGLSDRGDPFTNILERFLDEERQLSEVVSTKSNLNRGVKEVLRSIRLMRQQNSMKLSKSNERLSLNQIDQIITELKSIPDVNKQIECIKTSRQLKMQSHEYQMKIPSIKNKAFAKLTNSLP